MDGLTAVRQIREGEREGTLSPQMVVALTGNARQGQIDQAMEAGMDDGKWNRSRMSYELADISVIIKPYVLTNLLKKIREMSVKRDLMKDQEQD
jgi:CheY-like chemotaxis protein